ncbi:hypothetical protein [Acinetobacter guillouiae]|uniref:Uncharacterized protein n=1 Tax=Acinetobacter guillouiae NIPH 991 TaxID=1217656 RepID=N8WTI5_ACIGI|nr:hypothetical protein [Acinetobacter guillouiae]ENV15432.1 hypothetical protein F964_04157 [Acinetobacter guillouiae NIPH 991]
MTDSFLDYYEALERLKKDSPNRVPKGTKITNDAVSLEAGRGKGSIKKSRPIFADLIVAIQFASEQQTLAVNVQENKIENLKSQLDQCRKELEAALAREVSLLYELYELKKEINLLTGAKVIPIRKRSRDS